MARHQPASRYSASELLKIFDRVPDLRLLAQEETKEGDDLMKVQAKLKAEYLTKASPFVCSELLRRESSCSVCKRELTALDYEFFSNGVKLQLGIDGMTLHKVREHSEHWPDEIRDFLIDVKEGNDPTKPKTTSLASQLNPHTNKRIKLDRSEACPSLLRVFIKTNEAFREEELVGNKIPGTEIQLHVWKDSTLRELTDLLKEVEPTTRKWGTRLTFSLLFPDKRGKNVMKEIGAVDAHRTGKDDGKTLDGIHFQPGDSIGVAIYDLKKE